MEAKNVCINPVRKSRLEAQGYSGFSDAELEDHKYGIRFAYYLCTSLVALGLVLTNMWILGAMMLVAFWGSFPPRHPFDYLYNGVIRHWLGKPELPARAAQGRFACRIATVWLGATIYLFYAGQNMWGYSLGAALVVVGSMVSVLDICIPSIIYNFIFSSKTQEQ